jgi:hypothetical protein
MLYVFSNFVCSSKDQLYFLIMIYNSNHWFNLISLCAFFFAPVYIVESLSFYALFSFPSVPQSYKCDFCVLVL